MQWFTKFFTRSSPASRTARRHPPRVRLQVEELEDRLVMSTTSAISGSYSYFRYGINRVVNFREFYAIDSSTGRLVTYEDCNGQGTVKWNIWDMPQVSDVSDFHCVTTWSKLDVPWKGVSFATIAALARPHPDATHVLVHGYDGYTTNLPLEEALKDDVLLVHTAEGKPLPREHGGPVRMITPQLYAWKGSKWIKRIEFLTHDRPGFWETRGYSNTAHPWRDDRYS